MMRRYNTLRVRFVLWTAGLLLAALLCFSAFVYIIMSSELAKSLDDSLQLSAAQAVAAAIDNGQLSISDTVPESAAISSLHDRGYLIRVLSVDGAILKDMGQYLDLPIKDAALTAARKHQSLFETLTEATQAEPVRVYTTPILVQNNVIAILQVAQKLDSVNDTLEKLLTTLVISVPLLVALAAIGGYLLATHTLAPIDTITRTAQRISAHDLHERLNLPQTEDEVGRLAATFDTMLDRLEESFQRERQFTSDASHELRTPLTAMRTIIGVIRESRRTPERYEQALDDLEGEAKRLTVLVENLLHLARSDSGTNKQSKPIDFSLLLHDVVEAMQPLVQAKNLTFTCEVSENLRIIGDSDDLMRLFMNLLDNAIKYTTSGGITIRADRRGETVRVTVTDTGVGIAPDQLQHLFERFYRVDLTRTVQGSGLGLAIVQAIVKAHHGKIRVSSTMRKGTTFTVELPATN